MMDHIPLRLQSFKLHLVIPKNLRARLTKNFTLIYPPRTNATPLEINGVKIPSNKPTPIVLHRVQSKEAAGETDAAVYESTDTVFASDGLRFEVNFNGKKTLKGVFRRGINWVLDCELIGPKMWMEVSIMTDQGILIRERVKLKRNRFCQKLSAILEEDEMDMAGLNDMKHEDQQENDDGDGAASKDINWAINVGIFVAFVGVGLFVSRSYLRRLVR